jgi:amidase
MVRESGSASTAATYISRLPTTPGRFRLAVKDVIDIIGMKTTAGSRLVSDLADPADRDAECLRHARADNVAIVGKTNLHELAFGFTGVNPHFGTPINPLDPSVIPGGSSSGSAVAVATGDADAAIGTDTAGSVRMPAACCGIVGLKLTNGSVPLAGVWPLAPSLDSLGVFGRDVDATRIAAELLTGRDIVMRRSEPKVGRLRGMAAHPILDRAVDAALVDSNIKYTDIHLDHWDNAVRAARILIAYEAWKSNRSLVSSWEEVGSGIGQDVLGRLQRGKGIGESEIKEVSATRATLREQVICLLDDVEVLALPTLPIPPPQFALAEAVDLAHFTAPVNLLGMPALALPVPSGSGVVSLQFVAAQGGEAALLALAQRIARSVGSPWKWRRYR